MKNLTLIIAAALCCAACTKNSADSIVLPASTGNVISGGGTGGVAGTPPSNPLIVGKWRQVSDTTTYYVTVISPATPTNSNTVTNGAQTTTAFQFNADGTGIEDTTTITYSLSGLPSG